MQDKPSITPVLDQVEGAVAAPPAVKYYIVPNRHDKRKAMALKRKEDKEKRKHETK
jgi:hypothetical protein